MPTSAPVSLSPLSDASPWLSCTEAYPPLILSELSAISDVAGGSAETYSTPMSFELSFEPDTLEAAPGS